MLTDVQSILSNGNVHAIFLSEFGNMVDNIAEPLLCVKTFFNNMLHNLKLRKWKAFTDTPYVALVDVSIWKVKEHYQVKDLLSGTRHRAQHMLLKHAVSERVVRVFNNHTPSFIATSRNQKTKILTNMLAQCTAPENDAITQPVLAWVIGGDQNMPLGVALQQRDTRLQYSRSGHPVTVAPLEADFALSQGIKLTRTTSWVGAHSQPCASDGHDCVFVIGELEDKKEGDFGQDLLDLHGRTSALPSKGPPRESSACDFAEADPETATSPPLTEIKLTVLEEASSASPRRATASLSGKSHNYATQEGRRHRPGPA